MASLYVRGSAERSILTVVEMIRGKANYRQIVEVDGTFGDAYFLGFQRLGGTSGRPGKSKFEASNIPNSGSTTLY